MAGIGVGVNFTTVSPVGAISIAVVKARACGQWEEEGKRGINHPHLQSA